MASIEELSLKIEKLEKQLQSATDKASKLRAELSSGMYAATDIDIMREKLQALEATINKKQAKIL